MMHEQTPNPAPEARQLRLRERMMILSRRDRMGKRMPTWYRVLAAVLVLTAVLVVANRARLNRLRNDIPRAEPLLHGTVRLAFAGDVSLGGQVAAFGETQGYDALFTALTPLWQDASLVFASLEGTVLPEDGGDYPAADTAREPSPVASAALSAAGRAGLNAWSLANDHSLDYGSRGLEATLRAMEELDLQYAGAGENLTAAGSCRVLEADGLRVGFLACSAVNPNGPGPIDDCCLATTAYSALYRNVLLASETCDLVVVYVCWGELDGLTVTDAQRRVAHQLIQSGADVVIGAHPHVLQPVEQYRDGWIFYSLGNLVSDRGRRGERESVLVRLDLDTTNGVGAFTLIPLLLEDFRPAATENGFYVSQIRQSLLSELEAEAYTVSDNGRVTIPITLNIPTS